MDDVIMKDAVGFFRGTIRMMKISLPASDMGKNYYMFFKVDRKSTHQGKFINNYSKNLFSS